MLLLYKYMTTGTQDARLPVQSTLEAFSSLFLLCYKQKILYTQERLMLEMTDEIRIMLTACHSVTYNIQISWLSWKHILKKMYFFTFMLEYELFFLIKNLMLTTFRN